MSRRTLIFHPLAVLLFSLLGALLYASFVTLRFPGDKLSHQYLYVVPIVIPFVAFLLDRVEELSYSNIIQISLDALVTGTAIWRAVGHVPYISGHSLFLTYCLLTSRSRVAQATAAIVLLQVIYLKYIVWNDWVTSTSGMILGAIGAFLWHRFKPEKTIEQSLPGSTV